MSLHEDRIEKTLGSMTGDYDGQIPEPLSRIEVLIQKILENGGGSGGRGVPGIILNESQYDIHGVPIIDNPIEDVYYMVPNTDSEQGGYIIYMYVDEEWVNTGTTYEQDETVIERVDDLEDNIVLVQNAQPTSRHNKIWIPPEAEDSVEVPTYEEFSELKSAVDAIESTTPANLINGVSWEVGTINISNGADGPSTTRIRTVGFIDLTTINAVEFTIADGYKYVIDWYNADKTANKATPFGVWQTVNKSFTVPDGVAYMRLLIADTSDAAARVNFSQYLTVYGENNFIEAINKINGMENNIVQTYVDPLDVRVRNVTDYDPPFKYMDIELEKGGYDTSGNEQEDTSGIRWRTPNYIYVADMQDTAITVPEGFSMYVCLYSEGNVFQSRSTWGSGSTHDVAGNYSIRWTIVKATWVAMTEEEANCVKIKQILPWYNTLATSVRDIEKIPDYYKSQLATVIANVKTDMLAVGQDGDTFAFITDVHWNGNYKHSPNLLYYLKENTDLNLILCGGDLIDRSTSSKSSQITDMQNCIKAFKKVGIPFLTAIGNHERNSAGVTDTALYLSENEVFAITQNPVDLMPLYYSDLDRICYYYDKVATKTRYIFIDSGQNNITPYDITAEEIAWMTNVINATDSEYHIIVIVHQLGTYNLSNPISASNPFVYTQGAQDMLNALDNLLGNHKIEAVFTGHTHYDNNSTTTGGIPIVWTNSDAKWQYYQMAQPSDGTVEAQCFDVVTMDYTSKKIYLRRVGRGSNREVDY